MRMSSGCMKYSLIRSMQRSAAAPWERQPVVPAGGFAEAIRYLVRPNEDFIATLVICVYFAVLLGRTGASARQRTGQAAPAEVPVGASTSVYASTAVTAAAAGTGTAAATDAGTAATAGETRRRG